MLQIILGAFTIGYGSIGSGNHGVDNMTYLSNRITVDVHQCGGRPCVRGMRIRVSDVLDLFSAGLVPSEILKEMPDLTEEDIKACLEYASKRIDHPVLV